MNDDDEEEEEEEEESFVQRGLGPMASFDILKPF